MLASSKFLAWLVAFAVTELCEVPIYFAALTRTRAASWRVFFIAFGASAITHPIVWFAFPHLPASYRTIVVFAEAFAVLVEAAWLRAFTLRRALLWSIVANGTSVALGSLSRSIFGVP